MRSSSLAAVALAALALAGCGAEEPAPKKKPRDADINGYTPGDPGAAVKVLKKAKKDLRKAVGEERMPGGGEPDR